MRSLLTRGHSLNCDSHWFIHSCLFSGWRPSQVWPRFDRARRDVRPTGSTTTSKTCTVRCVALHNGSQVGYILYPGRHNRGRRVAEYTDETLGFRCRQTLACLHVVSTSFTCSKESDPPTKRPVECSRTDQRDYRTADSFSKRLRRSMVMVEIPSACDGVDELRDILSPQPP